MHDSSKNDMSNVLTHTDRTNWVFPVRNVAAIVDALTDRIFKDMCIFIAKIKRKDDTEANGRSRDVDKKSKKKNESILESGVKTTRSEVDSQIAWEIRGWNRQEGEKRKSHIRVRENIWIKSHTVERNRTTLRDSVKSQISLQPQKTIQRICRGYKKFFSSGLLLIKYDRNDMNYL